MAEPGETIRKRRRWPWVVAGVAILTLAGGPLVWQLRPLTADERPLVGHWRTVSHQASDYYLSADRRFMATYDVMLADGLPPVRGTWTASASSFQVRARSTGSPWQIRHWHAWVTAPIESASIRFDGPDRFWMGSVEFVRVPE